MNWTHYFLAVLLSGVASSFTDWLFMGVLFHDKYLATPEIWRGSPGQPEGSRIFIHAKKNDSNEGQLGGEFPVQFQVFSGR